MRDGYSNHYKLSESDIEKFEQFLSLFGANAPRILSLLFEILHQLVIQQFIIDSHLWSKNKSNNQFLKQFLDNIANFNKMQKYDKILDQNAFSLIKNVNNYYHSFNVSKGARKFFEIVTREQNGNFCAMCGSATNLEVDHIRPVRRGGSEESISNMQLLCKTCNRAKNDAVDNFLPEVLSIQLSSEISSKMRYRILYESGIPNPHRTQGHLGVCQMCGTDASKKQLHVVVKTPNSAANYSNLIVICEDCIMGGN